MDKSNNGGGLLDYLDVLTEDQVREIIENQDFVDADESIMDLEIDFGNSPKTYARPKNAQVLEKFAERNEGLHRSAKQITEESGSGISGDSEAPRRIYTPFGKFLRCIEASDLGSVGDTGFSGNKYVISSEDVDGVKDFVSILYFDRCLSELDYEDEHWSPVRQGYEDLDPVTRQGLWSDLVTDNFMDPSDEYDNSMIEQALEEAEVPPTYIRSIESYFHNSSLVSKDGFLTGSELEKDLARYAFNFKRTHGESIVFE